METEEAQPEAAPQEEDKSMDVDSGVKEEAASEATTEERPIDQSGSDEKPPEEMAVDEAAVVAPEGTEGNEAACDKGGLQIKDENASGDMQDDPVVVVDNLGEFGVSLSDAEQNNDEEERPPETVEPKVVVKSTGGIVMKVKAESIQPPISPVVSLDNCRRA
ncbi:uncharacterized protein LOC119378324 [Rhipicephalus sanguineus]|uniref:uncharacterized protein LOC119378324 n=1 Tax=Rhipicephalus sanguineus TaxID=34632 RepID=UPI001893944A|nr:uncharacterized protein LOC119378324 [Rhipicephalus sanguineus]